MRSRSYAIWVRVAVLDFDVADDRLDRGSPLHPVAVRGSDTTGVAGDRELEILCPIVAEITLLDVGEACFDLGQHSVTIGQQRVTVNRITVHGLGGEHEPHGRSSDAEVDRTDRENRRTDLGRTGFRAEELVLREERQSHYQRIKDDPGSALQPEAIHGA